MEQTGRRQSSIAWLYRRKIMFALIIDHSSSKLNNIWRDRQLEQPIKVRLYPSTVKAILLYLRCWILASDQNGDSTSKARFHYPSWRPELMVRVDGWPVSITRQHGPCWRARVSTSRVDGPSTRPVNSGSGTGLKYIVERYGPHSSTSKLAKESWSCQCRNVGWDGWGTCRGWVMTE